MQLENLVKSKAEGFLFMFKELEQKNKDMNDQLDEFMIQTVKHKNTSLSFVDYDHYHEALKKKNKRVSIIPHILISKIEKTYIEMIFHL